MEQERIEKNSFEDIEREFAQEGFLVLEEGTKYNLELEYTPSDQEPVYLDINGEKILQPKRSKCVIYSDLELEEPILVGRYVSYNGREGKKGLYKLPLTNEKILSLEKESKDFQKELINALGISVAYFGCEHPETLRDIDMSLFASQNPRMAQRLDEIGDPFKDAIFEEQERLNRTFVQSVLGDDLDLKDLTAVRIVTEL